MSRTAPSRTAFCTTERFRNRSFSVALAALVLMVAGCSTLDPAVRPVDDDPEVAVPTDSTGDSAADPSDLNNAGSDTSGEVQPEAAVRAHVADLAALPGSIAQRTADGALVVTNPDGTNERQLAEGGSALHTQPTWSNSGDRMAWSTIDADGAELVIAEVGEDAVTIVARTDVPAPTFYWAWAPEDAWLAGLRNGATGIELIIVDANSGDVRVAGPGQPFFTDWVDSDSLLAAIGGTVLVDIPAVGEPTQRQLDVPLGLFQAPLVLSEQAAIIAVDDSGNTVTRIDADGTRTPLATADGPVAMAVNPQGSQLAVVVGGLGAQSEVISFQTDPEPLPSLPVGQVSILDLGTGDIRTRPETNIAAVNWSPNGETLAVLQVGIGEATWRFITGEDVVSGTTFAPSQEFGSAYLPFSDQYERSSTWWSPDSSAFVFSGSVDGETGVWVDLIDDELEAVRIGSGDIAFWSP